MPSNPQIYPPDFPSTLPGIGTGPSPIDIVVSDLNETTRRTGVRRANERRILGYAAIANQNSRVSILNDLLPLLEVGTTVLAATFAGTKGMVAGSGQLANSGAWTNKTTGSFIGKLTYISQSYAQIGANLSISRNGLAGVGDNTKGYFCAGRNHLYQSINRIDRMVYSTESCAATASGLAGPGRYRIGAVNSAVAGYITGGDNDVSAYNAISKLLFGTESSSTIAASLSQSRTGVAGASNTVNGFFAGGGVWGTSLVMSNRIERFGFTSEAVTVLAATLSVARREATGRGNASAGYFFAGLGGSTIWDRIDKLTYSGETSASIAATLSVGRTTPASTPSSSDAYIHEGIFLAGSFFVSGRIDRFNYASESCAHLGRNSLYGRWYPAGLADFSAAVA